MTLLSFDAAAPGFVSLVSSIIARGTLLLVIACCLAGMFRRLPAMARHLVWLTAIIGVLVTPGLATLVPIRVAILPRAESSLTSWTLTPTGNLVPHGAVDVATAERRANGPSTRWWARTHPSYLGALGAVWLAVTSALLLWLAMGLVSVRRIRRGARALESSEWTCLLRDAARKLGVARVPALLVSDQIDMAFACGVIAPAVILPSEAMEWSDERRRAVLLHELAHIARRDIVGHTMAGLSCAVYWFHPLVWFAARRLRLESEMACDSIVLETGMAPADYAQHLLDLMTNLGPRVPSAAVGLGRPTEFEGRLAAILDGTSKKATLSRVRLGAILGCLVLLVVTVAAVIPVPRVQSGDGTASPILGHVAVGVTADAPRAQFPTEALERNRRVSGRAGGATIARDFADGKQDAEALSDSTIALLRRDGVAAIVNPMLEILREADSLGIRGSQGDSIATISRWYTIRRDLIWSALLAEPDLRVGSPERLAVSAAFDGATVATLSLLADAGARVLAVLTPEQRSKLSARTAAYLVAHPRSPGTGWSRRTASVVASSDRGDHYVRRGRGGG